MQSGPSACERSNGRFRPIADIGAKCADDERRWDETLRTVVKQKPLEAEVALASLLPSLEPLNTAASTPQLEAVRPDVLASLCDGLSVAVGPEVFN